jgi:3-oxoadipate enol-lactonase
MPTADLGKVRLHYEVSGPASDEIIMLAHSLGANLHMWDKIVPALETRFRVVRYDSRGHGSSTVPSGPYSIAELAGDAAALLNHLHLESVNFCGLSLGGMIAMWLGINEPSRVNRLIFANTGARIGTREGWEDRIAGVRKAGMEPLADAMLGRWFTQQFRHGHPQEMESIRAMIESTPVEGYVGCVAALRDGDLRAEIQAIRARALIITGNEDSATPPENGRWVHEALPNSAYLELKAAHLSAWECPEEFQRAVIDFLS